jgi:hypothetical protein
MGWFDSLKALFHIEIDYHPTKIIYVNSGNKYESNDEERKLSLNLNQLDESEKKELRAITQEYLGTGELLLEAKTKSRLEDLCDYTNRSPNSSVLDFFKDIIPSADLEALQASLYLREKFNSDRISVPQLKDDIVKSFGDRGRNIANLCTAGYFEHFLMDLHNSSPDQFSRLYELIVSKSIIAVFVYHDKSKEDIKKDIDLKIRLCKNYGIPFMHIHGIGKGNTKKIKEILAEEAEYFSYYQKNIFEDKDKGIFAVELLLPKRPHPVPGKKTDDSTEQQSK